jgi:hypothetical protein
MQRRPSAVGQEGMGRGSGFRHPRGCGTGTLGVGSGSHHELRSLMTPATARTRWWVPASDAAGLASHGLRGPVEDDRRLQPRKTDLGRSQVQKVVAPIHSEPEAQA